MARSIHRASQRPSADALFDALEPRALLAGDFDAVTFDSLYDFVRDVPAVLSPDDAQAYGYGANVLVLGDINSDQIDDFAVAAPGVKPDPLGRFEAPGPGRVFVFSGADLSLIRTLSDGAVGFGASLLSILDLNGDAVPDLAVGSPNYSAGGPDDHHGRVTVYSGATGAVLRTITGTNPRAELGYSLGWADDINNDAVIDLIAGAPGDGPDSASVGPGRVYIFSLANGNAISVFDGESPGDRFGHAVSRAGNIETGEIDVGPEILIGAPGFDLPESPDQGRAYIFHISTGTLAGTLMLQAADGSGTAVVPGARTGSSVVLDPYTSSGIFVVGSPGAGEVDGVGARSGVVDVFRALATSPESFGPVEQHRQDGLIPDARLGETLTVTGVRYDINAIYATQPGVPEAPITYITGHIALPNVIEHARYAEFAESTAIARTDGLLVGGFADGIVRVSFGTLGVYHMSPGASFGVLTSAGSDFNHVPLALRAGNVEPLIELRGRTLAAVGDSGAIITADVPNERPLDHYLFIKGGIVRHLGQMITSVDGPALGASLAIVGILPDDDVLMTSDGRSYRLDRGVLRYLGEGAIVDANQSGLTVAIRAGSPVIWLPDGSEAVLDGFTLPSSRVVSAAGRVLLRRDAELHIWENGSTRLFYTMPQVEMTAEISDANIVKARSILYGPRQPGVPASMRPVLGHAAYLLNPDGVVITDITALDGTLTAFDLSLTTSGLLIDRSTAFQFVAGSVDRVNAQASTSSTIADAAQNVVAANLSYGLGVFRFAGDSDEGSLTRLDAGASFVRSVVAYTDPRNGRSYLVANVGGTLYWYSQLDSGGFDRGRALPAASESPISGDLATFTSTDGRVHIAAQTFDGEIVLIFQLDVDTPDDLSTWAGANLTTDHLDPQGAGTPRFVSRLATYTTSWDGMNIAGLDENGDLRVVWWAPGLTLWKSSNLSAIAFGDGSLLSLTGNVAPYITPWDGINFAVTDTAGVACVIWWVPTFGGNWRFEDFDIPPVTFRPGSLTAYVTPWNGLNIAGLTNDGQISTLWWAPATFRWRSQALVPSDQPSLRFTGPLASAVNTDSGALNIAAVTDDHSLARLLWSPTLPDWTSSVV